MRGLVVTVMSKQPDARGRFQVHVGGYFEDWTIEQIKRAVAEGADLRERVYQP